MSESNRSARVLADRRILAALILAAGAVAVAAMLSAGAEARSAAAPANSSPPTISGTAVEGEELTASSGEWTGTPPIAFAYAWERCDNTGASCVAIGGATAQSYDVAVADIDKTLRVVVTATNPDPGSPVTAVSAPTAVVTAVTNPVNTAEPVISGSPVEGSTLTTSTGTWTGTGITYAYQWVRCEADGGLPDGSNCPTIAGATSSSYTLTSDEIGKRLRVQVTASNSAGSTAATSNPTATVTPSTTKGPPANTVEPSITGTPTQGQTLFASVGTWSGETPITYAYQWVRCGADGGLSDGSNCTSISGATSSSYLLTSNDVGQRLRIRVTASNSLGVQTVASNATAAVSAPATASVQAPRNTVLPSVSGTAALGQTLFASVGAWTGTAITYTYQWLRCGADGGLSDGSNCPSISGATNSSYVLVTADVGQRLRVRVTGRNSAGTATATSTPSAQVQSTSPTTSPSPDPSLPPGAIKLPNGKVSIPVSSVSLPVRLVVGDVVFTPNPVRSRQRPLELRVQVVDTRGYVVRDALVFARATPLLTSAPGEQRSGRDGSVRFRMMPGADFPLQDGHNVQFWVRTRKQGDDVLAGVSNRRLVQVATAG
jgi:hypothetical protein